ncbi:MAG: family 10 glycosylhydrolase [Prevotella sp.]|nr:family 10 glycosylhydrolase [Prevotella sp.]MBQ9655064.1 family 10 glycosylhydrolase [Prevotella sp.]
MKIVKTTLLLLLLALTMQAQQKRAFRGAWIQCVNGQFKGMSTANMQRTLTYQLNELQKDGCNAIIFQVRPECDALYESSIEPWSYYLTGEQGDRPYPYWDPLAWMIRECHKRGMELHAWINPYRAKTKVAHLNARNHVVVRHPEWCFEYDGLTLLNPALKQCRDYICDVVRDIVTRYDVDGLHIDDYFYPYPVAGVQIPDAANFHSNNYGISNREDWRRQNVNMFIEQLYHTVHDAKPWVKVGISPFGIYRNQRSDPKGSRTNGLQNYDDLYADVLLWDEMGWMDYCVPQLYWEIGHKAADYDELIRWWDRNIKKSDLYIGEDVERTVKHSQQPRKMALHRQMSNVKGMVLWYAKAAVDNVGGYGTQLRQNYWRNIALQPVSKMLGKKTPKKPRKVKSMEVDGQRVVFWTAPKAKSWQTEATKYVVYRFMPGERVDTDDASKIVAVTNQTFYEAPGPGTYVVTALNRLQGESKKAKVKVKY